MFRSFLFRLAFLAKSLPFYGSVKDCAPGKDSILTLNSVNMVPVNPSAGDNVTLYLDYTVPNGLTVTGGQTEYDITYNYIPFSPSYEPLCQNIPCPLQAGRYSNASSSQWPTGLSGLLVSRMKWWDENQNLLLCVEMSGQTGNLRKVSLIGPVA